MLALIAILLIVGLIAGAIARLLLPGRDPIGLLGTIVVGVIGSFLGGFLQNLLFYHTLSIHRLHPAGIIGSIIGAFIVLLSCACPGTSAGAAGVATGAGSESLRRRLPA